MTDLQQPVLQDKIVLITGGSRGLGRAMALGLAAEGASVVIASRKLEQCEATAAEVTRQTGRPAHAIAANVGRWEDCDALIERVYRDVGPVEVLINNAGMSPLYPSVREVSEELFDKVVGVNLKGPFRLSAEIGSRMAAGTGGSIINISSVEAGCPQPGALPYAAAKAGLETLTAGFAQSFGPSVRVNAIRCGMFRTDIADAWGDPAQVDRYAARSTALGRVGEPREIVGAAVFLASDASAYCTGSVLTVDGGKR